MAKVPIIMSIDIGPGITVSCDVKPFDGTRTIESVTYTITAEGDQGRQRFIAALAKAIGLCTFAEAVELVEMIRG